MSPVKFKEKPVAQETGWERSSANHGGGCPVQSERSWAISSNPGPRLFQLTRRLLPPQGAFFPIRSHEAAARRVQRPLQAQSWMRRACAHKRAAQQLAEESQHVPIVLGGALEVSAAPAPAHQGSQCAPRPEPQPLPVPLVAHHENGRFRCARWPGGQRRMKVAAPGTPMAEESLQRVYTH